MARIGMIGGSGFDDPDFLTDVKLLKKGTPFGHLSHDLMIGKAGDTEVVILLRHGKGHRIRPSSVNYQANIWALKDMGVTHIIATSACGVSARRNRTGAPRIPDQFIDRTTSRKSTFYEGDQVVHISMADPFCEKLRQILSDTHSRKTFPTTAGRWSPLKARDSQPARKAECSHVGRRHHQHVHGA